MLQKSLTSLDTNGWEAAESARRSTSKSFIWKALDGDGNKVLARRRAERGKRLACLFMSKKDEKERQVLQPGCGEKMRLPS